MIATLVVGPHPLLRAVPPAGHEERTLHHWGVRSLHASSEREHRAGPNATRVRSAVAMVVITSER